MINFNNCRNELLLMSGYHIPKILSTVALRHMYLNWQRRSNSFLPRLNKYKIAKALFCTNWLHQISKTRYLTKLHNHPLL